MLCEGVCRQETSRGWTPGCVWTSPWAIGVAGRRAFLVSTLRLGGWDTDRADPGPRAACSLPSRAQPRAADAREMNTCQWWQLTPRGYLLWRSSCLIQQASWCQPQRAKPASSIFFASPYSTFRIVSKNTAVRTTEYLASPGLVPLPFVGTQPAAQTQFSAGSVGEGLGFTQGSGCGRRIPGTRWASGRRAEGPGAGKGIATSSRKPRKSERGVMRVLSKPWRQSSQTRTGSRPSSGPYEGQWGLVLRPPDTPARRERTWPLANPGKMHRGWLARVMFGRNQYNIVKQLASNKQNLKKKERKETHRRRWRLAAKVKAGPLLPRAGPWPLQRLSRGAQAPLVRTMSQQEDRPLTLLVLRCTRVLLGFIQGHGFPHGRYLLPVCGYISPSWWMLKGECDIECRSGKCSEVDKGLHTEKHSGDKIINNLPRRAHL